MLVQHRPGLKMELYAGAGGRDKKTALNETKSNEEPITEWPQECEIAILRDRLTPNLTEAK